MATIPHERNLRILTLFTTALATPLLIATTIISVVGHRRSVTTFCFGYFPLVMTAVASTISLYYQRRHGRVPGPSLALLDGAALCMYLAILIPIWAIEINGLREAKLGLLAGYLTSPMITNM